MKIPRRFQGKQRWSFSDMAQCNADVGQFWFSKDTMRFFGTRLLGAPASTACGVYFVSSEKPPHGPRRYSVRKFDPRDCTVDTVGEVCAYKTSKQAYAARDRATASCRRRG